ncbi:hypothetical protein QJQ45_028440, partial [Haematococcus lacustris]
ASGSQGAGSAAGYGAGSTVQEAATAGAGAGGGVGGGGRGEAEQQEQEAHRAAALEDAQAVTDDKELQAQIVAASLGYAQQAKQRQARLQARQQQEAARQAEVAARVVHMMSDQPWSTPPYLSEECWRALPAGRDSHESQVQAQRCRALPPITYPAGLAPSSATEPLDGGAGVSLRAPPIPWLPADPAEAITQNAVLWAGGVRLTWHATPASVEAMAKVGGVRLPRLWPGFVALGQLPANLQAQLTGITGRATAAAAAAAA